MALIKYVYENGSGDYPDIETAFNAMLASGVAATGDITEYLMVVDSGVYSGSLSGYIPYSGIFTIQGDYTQFNLDKEIDVSGIYLDPFTPNLVIEGMTIFGSGLTNPIFPVGSGFGLSLNDVQLVECSYVSNVSNGSFTTENTEAFGLGDSYFVTGTGLVVLEDTSISNYGTGIYVDNASLTKTQLHYNDVGIYGVNSTIGLNYCLINGNTTPINDVSGNLSIQNSTIDGLVLISGTALSIDRSILSNSGYNIQGTAASGSYISDSCLYISGCSDTTGITFTNIGSGNPKFNNTSVGDYNLKFQLTDGSPYIEHYDNAAISSGVTIQVDQANLKLSDNRGSVPLYEFLPFIYTQGSSLVFTDLGKETKFAEAISQYKTLYYELLSTASFTKKNVQTEPAFNPNINIVDDFPHDWDYKAIETTQIEDHNKYIVPRSIVDIEEIIKEFLAEVSADNTLYQSIEKQHIKPYDQTDFRGISFDYNLSSPTHSIMWVIDGANQSLLKQDVFSSEILESYPLLSTTPTKTLIRPSGLIYVGVDGDYYRFRKELDPNVELHAETEDGQFQWLCTELNTKYDVRGVLSYKNNIFITASDYQTQDVLDRTVIPSGQAVGKILWYYNNDLFYNYMKKPGVTGGPRENILASGNYYPTDLTAYEDGSIFVADYSHESGLFRYNLAFDYALIQSSYDNETRVLLREPYNNIDL